MSRILLYTTVFYLDSFLKVQVYSFKVGYKVHCHPPQTSVLFSLSYNSLKIYRATFIVNRVMLNALNNGVTHV